MEFREFLVEARAERFTVYKRELNGKLSNREELNADELDTWMNKVYGKFANIRVIGTTGSKTKTIDYTDNGTDFEKVKS